MKRSHAFSLIAMLCSVSCFSAAKPPPSIADLSVSQKPTRLVEINYTLLNGPAVVTMDVETNRGDGVWCSIGGWNLFGTNNAAGPKGDVWKVVTAESGSAAKVIRWRPDRTWPGHVITNRGTRVRLKAWTLNNTPDYMVIDLAPVSDERVRYFQSEDFLPGGILSNRAYRTTKLLMKKVKARNATYMMGSLGEIGRGNNEYMRMVTLPSDFYLGVFELTQKQASQVVDLNFSGSAPPYFTLDSDMRPLDNFTYNEMRLSPDNEEVPEYEYPNPPNPASVLGLMRARTVCEEFPLGIDLDLPSEREWEFACRAGHCEGYFGNGVYCSSTDSVPGFPGRYSLNVADQSITVPSPTVGPENGTAIAGSYEPNSWGFYDMHGNVSEYCLDRYTFIPEDAWYCGSVCTTTVQNTTRLLRGGDWRSKVDTCRSAHRRHYAGALRVHIHGFRLLCRAGLH